MEFSSKQRARAAALAAQIIEVGKKIEEAAKPPLGSSEKIVRVADQVKLGAVSPHSDGLGRVLKDASAELRELAEDIDQLLEKMPND